MSDQTPTYGADRPASRHCPIEGCVAGKERFALMCDDHEGQIPGDLLTAYEIGWRTARVGSEGEWRAFVDARTECIDRVNQLESDRREALVAGDGGLSGEGNPL